MPPHFLLFRSFKGFSRTPFSFCSTLPTPGGNPLLHFLRCVVSMFTQSVNADVYRALRRLFMERMGLDAEFDFHG